MRKLLAGLSIAALTAVAPAIAAGAAPTNAPKAFHGFATCTNGQSYSFVVNNANGNGPSMTSPSQAIGQAVFAPAHLSDGSVFHPTSFDLLFTITGPNVPGGSQSFQNTAARTQQTGDTTCRISGSQAGPDGSTLSLRGSVTGTISG